MSRPAIDITGQRFGRFVVTGRSSQKHPKDSLWDCLCDCGKSKAAVRAYHLRSGTARSCGCSWRNGRRVQHRNLVGQRFGRLVVTQQAAAKNGDKALRWDCRCDCGGTKLSVRGTSLQYGSTQSCGCAGSEKARTLAALYRPGLKHGMTNTGTHVSWIGMRQRCQNPKHHKYPLYGGRGITVCERWRSFENFLADMGERPEGTSIDRIDGDGNYEPGNCRWATMTEQNRNRKRRK